MRKSPKVNATIDRSINRRYSDAIARKSPSKARKTKWPYNQDMKTLRGELHRGLLAAGQTQKWLAQKSGVGEATISRFISGEKQISVNNLDKLFRALGWDGVKFPKQPKE